MKWNLISDNSAVFRSQTAKLGEPPMNSWLRYSIRAINELRNGTAHSQFGLRRKLQLLVVDSFGAAKSWEIIVKKKHNDSSIADELVLYRIWRADIDYKEFDGIEASPPIKQPTIEDYISSISSAESNTIFQRFSAMTISVCPEHPDTQDGVIHEITIGSALQGTAYRWSNSGPVEWRELVSCVKDMRQLFESLPFDFSNVLASKI